MEERYMENKEELSKAVNNLENNYDAFYMMNRYSWKDNTHAKEAFFCF